MKHISKLLIQSAPPLQEGRPLRLYTAPVEKGTGEWRACYGITDDTVHAYHVHVPEKAIVVVSSNNVLRITYPPARSSHRA